VGYCVDEHGNVIDAGESECQSVDRQWVPGERPGGGCFIATAAFGSELAPQVQELRALRDGVIYRTQTGRDWFDEYWSYYLPISSPLAEQMNADQRLMELMRFSIVEPWLYYLRLALRRPDWDAVDLETLEPSLAEFLRSLREDMDAWIGKFPVVNDYSERDPVQAAHELNVVLDVIVRTGKLAYLSELIERGYLPLRFERSDEQRIVSILRYKNRTNEEVALILGGDAPGTRATAR